MAKDRQGPDDPKGLIAEAYRIDGITEDECRSIFLDWALSLPGEPTAAIERLLDGRPEHPMTKVLRAGLAAPERTGRRGGRTARIP
ncbi:hypothetical protein SAMN05444004_104119 [Jannaschia faecimaris]|uniref:Uncharacterized protein n=1 Tax=Jannaschia faecimaris TaxID=1244108 RepID=A0A1H3NV20_9RHOB|nr:hypothetical protein [Jannaschia faecimaris]SDY92580.1 hypothetical protein SAMN05444004_104119 [Jannaschia faecimaris]